MLGPNFLLSFCVSTIPQHIIWAQSPPHQLSAHLPTPAPRTSVFTQPACPSYSRYQNPAQRFDKDVGFVTYFKLIKEICFSQMLIPFLSRLYMQIYVCV